MQQDLTQTYPTHFGYGFFHYHCFFSNAKFSHRCLKTVIRDSVLGREKGEKELYQPCLSLLAFMQHSSGSLLRKNQSAVKMHCEKAFDESWSYPVALHQLKIRAIKRKVIMIVFYWHLLSKRCRMSVSYQKKTAALPRLPAG